MIKIVSGNSNPIESTVALVNLCNLFNNRGYGCIFYGPDYWHLDKCSSAKLNAFAPERGDIIIANNLKLLSPSELFKLTIINSPPVKWKWMQQIKDITRKYLPIADKPDGIKLILSWREGDLFDLRQLRLSLFDKIHYISDSQQKSNAVKRPYFICNDPFDNLIPSPEKPDKVAGVIGTIRKENMTHLSIESAIQDGMTAVVLYGYLFDPVYYYNTIEPITKKYPGKIKFAGFVDNKQQIYDSISDVYSSVCKPWSPLANECRMTNTNYHPPKGLLEDNWLTNDTVFEIWKNELQL